MPDVVWFLHNSPKMESIMAEKKTCMSRLGQKGSLAGFLPCIFLEMGMGQNLKGPPNMG